MIHSKHVAVVQQGNLETCCWEVPIKCSHLVTGLTVYIYQDHASAFRHQAASCMYQLQVSHQARLCRTNTPGSTCSIRGQLPGCDWQDFLADHLVNIAGGWSKACARRQWAWRTPKDTQWTVHSFLCNFSRQACFCCICVCGVCVCVCVCVCTRRHVN